MLREEAPHVLGALVRRFGRFDVAEDAVQEALLAAARQWPADGTPSEPRTWLIRVGYRRMVDLLRADQARRRRELEVGAAAITNPAGSVTSVDDSLAVVLLCCHPALTQATRVALTLRAVGGLTTAEIARAYGVPEATMATRISRAKQQLRTAGARFDLRDADERGERLRSALAVLYLVFNEGYTATSGDRLGRVDLAAEAIRLARMLVEVSDEPEAAGLLALMLLTHARREARLSAGDELVPLAEQDRTRWDRAALDEGLALLDAVWPHGGRGPYQLQAAIAAVHARAASFAQTDWQQIVALYLALEQQAPSAPGRLGRVVAVAHAFGPVAGLRLLDELDREHGLSSDPLTRRRVPAVRAHLLERCHDRAGAAAQFRLAAELAGNEVERAYLLSRAGEATRDIVDS